jgi:hypothetical protein
MADFKARRVSEIPRMTTKWDAPVVASFRQPPQL